MVCSYYTFMPVLEQHWFQILHSNLTRVGAAYETEAGGTKAYLLLPDRPVACLLICICMKKEPAHWTKLYVSSWSVHQWTATKKHYISRGIWVTSTISVCSLRIDPYLSLPWALQLHCPIVSPGSVHCFKVKFLMHYIDILYLCMNVGYVMWWSWLTNQLGHRPLERTESYYGDMRESRYRVHRGKSLFSNHPSSPSSL